MSKAVTDIKNHDRYQYLETDTNRYQYQSVILRGD